MPSEPATGRRNGYMQKRGHVRRQKLLDAAIELLSEHEIDEVSFSDITRRAGVPTASAYHFYRNKNDLLAALVDHYHWEVNSEIIAPVNPGMVNSWSDVIDQIIERAIVYFDKPVPRKLFYSGKAPAQIKLLDRAEDRVIGLNIASAFDKLFELPPFPNRERVFFIMVEIIDTIFTLSVIEHGHITEAMGEEAGRAAKAYLRTYLPDVLLKRQSPADRVT